MTGKTSLGVGIATVLGVILLISLSDKQSSKVHSQTPVGDSTGGSSSISDSSDSTETEKPRQFAGYDCTSDCSGHEAGYNWAEEHGIDDEADCDQAEQTSNSPSFGEGCRAFVTENGGDSDDDGDDDGPHN